MEAESWGVHAPVAPVSLDRVADPGQMGANLMTQAGVDLNLNYAELLGLVKPVNPGRGPVSIETDLDLPAILGCAKGSANPPSR